MPHQPSEQDELQELLLIHKDVQERITKHPKVIEVLFFHKNNLPISICPDNIGATAGLYSKLQEYQKSVYLTVRELDVMDELLAFRMETHSSEILVAGGKDVGVCAVVKRTCPKKNKKIHNAHF